MLRFLVGCGQPADNSHARCVIRVDSDETKSILLLKNRLAADKGSLSQMPAFWGHRLSNDLANKCSMDRSCDNEQNKLAMLAFAWWICFVVAKKVAYMAAGFDAIDKKHNFAVILRTFSDCNHI